MTIYKEIILEIQTGTETKIEFSKQELQDFNEEKEISRQQEEIQSQEQREKAEARSAAEAKLLALGLTTEDLKALLG